MQAVPHVQGAAEASAAARREAALRTGAGQQRGPRPRLDAAVLLPHEGGRLGAQRCLLQRQGGVGPGAPGRGAYVASELRNQLGGSFSEVSFVEFCWVDR